MHGEAEAMQSRAGERKCEKPKLIKEVDVIARWSPEEIQYLRSNWHKSNAKEIASHLGRTANSVDLKARQLGLRKNKHWTEDEREYLRKNWNVMPVEQLAENLGRTIYSVRHELQQMKLGLSPKYCKKCGNLFWPKVKQEQNCEDCRQKDFVKKEAIYRLKSMGKKIKNPICPVCKQKAFVGKITEEFTYFCSNCYVEFIPFGPVYEICQDGSLQLIS